MDNNKIENLTRVLKKLNEEGATPELRNEASKIVSEINPLELSVAEQRLVEEGMNPQDLRHLCTIHMEVLKGELEKIKTRIEPGHVIFTLIAEHEMLLKFLDELDELNSRIQKIDNFDAGKDEIEKLKTVAFNLLDAENHHQREEKVLFVEMENRNITGPTRIMRMEHDDLRGKKRRLKDIAENACNIDFNEFKNMLDHTAKYIVFNLRDHIFKENYILYPTALDSIEDVTLWTDMKNRCDGIGYCGFTPKQ